MTKISGQKKNERRLSNRSLLPSKITFEVSTHLSTFGAKKGNNSGKITSQVRNISEGGVGLSTKVPLEAAQVIKISLPLPNVNITTPTLAEVCWVQKDSGKGIYHAGLRFLL
ncbi:MAG TPA: PilZ domain-containing protein [Nitrospiria bacterium]